MTAQVIKRNGKPEWAVLPYEEYQALLEKAEMLDDIAAYDKAIAADEENIPQEVVESLVAGENPLKVWRTYRGLTQAQLAEQVGLSQSHLVTMEKGERKGTIKVLKRIAQTLRVDIDDLYPLSEGGGE
ncbi:helix-turn-helix domain protein [Nitrosococcus halophilus Nc 4]|uniref:Helix-turn-helix domain protein n=1 Tax=Nitrosococcus halophilus (strain Nc4) TaxID=472759 RepID=D5BWQ9_NITHN|nr:helix-turn-helix transcriptional regulator [Nitrosococcus halophilus]ADE13790.1 helix-turn-helix domain protein [Nitrosococcus halophilus Nc 4]